MGLWFVYIVKCKDDSYYTGITTNIKRRVREHNQKLGAKSLLGKLPVSLVYKEIHENQASAAKREGEIKSWRKQKKVRLVEGFSLRSASDEGPVAQR